MGITTENMENIKGLEASIELLRSKIENKDTEKVTLNKEDAIKIWRYLKELNTPPRGLRNDFVIKLLMSFARSTQKIYPYWEDKFTCPRKIPVDLRETSQTAVGIIRAYEAENHELRRRILMLEENINESQRNY